MNSVKEFENTVDKIVKSKRRAQLVVAAAGSGKTKLLIDTFVKKINDEIINPEREKVILFTFTNNAADELVVRVSDKLKSLNKEYLLDKIYIGTIHGWCNNLLKEEGQLANTKVVDELEQVQLVQRIYQKLQLEKLYSGHNKFEKIDKFINDLYIFYNESLEIDNEVIPPNVRLATQNYLNFMKEQRLIDFGLLVKNAILVLKNSKFSGQQIEIYVDEYQDVNPAQVELLKAMLKGNAQSTILAVGDPRQAIYQWRGGDVQRILLFKDDFPDSEIHEITVNHRSRKGIVNYANLIARSMNFSTRFKIKDMVTDPMRIDPNASVIIDDTTFPNELGVVETVQNLINNGIKPGEIAILLRSVLYHGQDLMDSLSRAHIPYYSPNRNSGVHLINNFMLPIIDLISIMDDPPIPGNKNEETELEIKINEYLTKISTFCEEKDVGKINKYIAEWYGKLVKSQAVPLNNQYNFRQQLFDFAKSVGFKIEPSDSSVQEGFSAITQIMRAIEEAYRRRFSATYNIRSPPVDVFTKNLRWQLSKNAERWSEIGMLTSRTDAVTISTVHGAKGLEWPIVILPFAWEDRFPRRPERHRSSFPDIIAQRYGTSIEDERRLWYVAITRARDRLYIYSGSDKRRPSVFVDRGLFETLLKEPGNVSVSRNSSLADIEDFFRPHYLHLGVSDFILLLECPYHFYLRRIVGVDVPVGSELGAGNIAHRAIQRITREGTHNIDKIVDEEVYLPLGEIDQELMIKKSTKLKLQQLIDTGILKKVDLTEHRFSFKLGDVVVTGFVDATIKDGESVIAVDWKFSVHKELEHRYNHQLKIYAYGLRNGGYYVSEGRIYDLSRKGTAAQISTDVSTESVSKLIEEAGKRLENLSVSGPYTTPGIVPCGACDISSVCHDFISASDYTK